MNGTYFQILLPTAHEEAILRVQDMSGHVVDMSNGRYTESDSAGDSTGTVQMLIGVY